MGGQSVELLLKCIYADDYVGDTKSLKCADVLLKQYNIPENIVENLMVCCSAGKCQYGQVYRLRFL